MAAPPKLRIVRAEDYKEAPSWFADFLRPVNEFVGAVTAALSQGLTRSENMRSTVKAIEFTSAATGPTDVTVLHGLGQRPSDIWVGRLEGAVTAPWAMSWEYGDDASVKVRFLGLPASTAFKARLIVE